jgi:hypothetical protein
MAAIAAYNPPQKKREAYYGANALPALDRTKPALLHFRSAGAMPIRIATLVNLP